MTTNRCTRCPTRSPTLRRGLCPRCYLREYNGRSLDDACAVCGQDDARVLVRRKLGAERAETRVPGEARTRALGGEMVTLCGNHAVLARSPTMTLEGLRSVTPIPPATTESKS